MLDHPVASRETWLEARRALLAEEKALTRARDALAEKRRALPWVKVDKDYVFRAHEGQLSLSDLFRGKRQLIVYHFMFGADWEAGCTGCSFLSDHVDAVIPHLEQKDVAYVAVSRAPIGRIEAFRRRMGWSFRWVSAADTDFNQDFSASFTPEQMAGAPATYNFAPIQPPIEELPGVSVFIRGDDGQIFHSYSQYARGGEDLLAAYRLLDMTPLGRQEAPGQGLGAWVKLHDLYETKAPDETKAGACPACAAE